MVTGRWHGLGPACDSRLLLVTVVGDFKEGRRQSLRGEEQSSPHLPLLSHHQYPKSHSLSVLLSQMLWLYIPPGVQPLCGDKSRCHPPTFLYSVLPTERPSSDPLKQLIIPGQCCLSSLPFSTPSPEASPIEGDISYPPPSPALSTLSPPR